MKTCSKCKQSKRLEEFHRKRAAPDGRQAYCKSCTTAHMAAYRPANRKRFRTYGEAWRAVPGNKSRKLAYMHERYVANRDVLREKDQKYKQANVEHRAAYDRARAGTAKRKEQATRSRANRRDKIASYNAARKSLLRSLPTEPINRVALYERDGGKCHICGDPVERDAFHLDHLIPASRGGGYVKANLRVAHPACNMSRGPGRKPAQLLLFG